MSSDCGAANVFFYQGLRTLTAQGLFLTVQTINVYIMVTPLSLRVTLNVCHYLFWLFFSGTKLNCLALKKQKSFHSFRSMDSRWQPGMAV